MKSNSRLSTLRSSTMPCFRTTTYPFSSLVRSSRYTDALIFSTHKCICYQTQQPLHGFWASQEHIAYVSYIKWETHSFAHMMIRESEMDGAKLEVLYILFLFHCVLSKIGRFVDFLIVSLCIDHLWAMMLFNWWLCLFVLSSDPVWSIGSLACGGFILKSIARPTNTTHQLSEVMATGSILSS